MKNRSKFRIYKLLIPIYAVLSFLSACGVVYSAGGFPEYVDMTKQYIFAGVWIVVGVFLGYAVHSLVHELSHVLALKYNKATILEFSVLGFVFTRENGKVKVRYSLKSEYAGFVSFVSKDPTHAGLSLYFSVTCAWVGSFITLVAYVLLFKFAGNEFALYCIFGGMLISGLYAVLVNFLSFMPSSDGAVLMGAGKNYDSVVAVMETQSRLYYGESLAEMNDELFASDDKFINGYYSYLRLLQKGDLVGAERMLSFTIENNEKTLDNSVIALDLEKFYLALKCNDEKTVEELKADAVEFCDSEINPTTLRVMIAYRTWTGETEWKNALQKSFANYSSKSFEGLYKTEKDVIDRMC